MKFCSFFLFALLVFAQPASAMPGFFVGSDEAGIAIPSTKIIIASKGTRHVMTVMPNIKSTSKELALLMPVPASITRDNIRTLDSEVFNALDKLSAPRLIEAFDSNPCTGNDAALAPKTITSATYNTTVEANYDISILQPADGINLLPWLEKNGYQLLPKADQIIEPYTKKGMAFVLVKIRRSNSGDGWLPPIQLTYDAPKMVLPIRLGLVNRPKPVEPPRAGKEAIVHLSAPDMTADREIKRPDLFNDDAQALTVYVLTQQGMATSPLMRSVQLANVRNEVSLPSIAKDHFTAISDGIKNYRAKAESNAMIIEFAGNADVADNVLQSVGVSWLNDAPPVPRAGQTQEPANNDNLLGGMMLPKAAYPKHARAQANAPIANGKAYLTRLYLRYGANAMPQDLLLQESTNQQSVNTAYHTQVPWTPSDDAADKCEGAALYQSSIETREAQSTEAMLRLTGWSTATIREKFGPEKFGKPK